MRSGWSIEPTAEQAERYRPLSDSEAEMRMRALGLSWPRMVWPPVTGMNMDCNIVARNGVFAPRNGFWRRFPGLKPPQCLTGLVVTSTSLVFLGMDGSIAEARVHGLRLGVSAVKEIGLLLLEMPDLGRATMGLEPGNCALVAQALLSLGAAQFRVTAKGGEIYLTGTVGWYDKNLEVEMEGF